MTVTIRDTPPKALLDYDFEASAGYWITLAYQAYTRTFQQQLTPHGITFRQAQVLGWLAAQGPQSQRVLAERMMIEPPNLVGVLDRMEQAGLLERRPCDRDRRKKLIHLLPAANKLWEKIAGCGRVVREQATAGMSAAEREELKRLLAKVEANLVAADAGDAQLPRRQDAKN